NKPSIDIWIADASRGGITRLTTDGAEKWGIQWSGDGSRIAYNKLQGNHEDFYERPASGSEGEHLLFQSPSIFKGMTQITPDGSYLVFEDLGRTTQRDL